MKRIIYLFAFVLFSTTTLMAQPLSKEKDLKPLALKMEPDGSDKEVLVAAADGTASEKGELILLSGQDMFQPVIIMVYAVSKSNPVQVSLHKDSWDENEMSAATDAAEGYCEFKVRSAGEIGIKLKGNAASYVVMAMSGKEIMPKMESPFVKKGKENKEAGKTESGGKSNTMLYVIIGILALALIVVAIKFAGRKNKTAGMLLIGLSLATVTSAQNRIRGNTVEEIRAEVERILEKNEKEEREKIDKVREHTEKAYKILKGGKDLWDAYKNLGSCMNTAIPAGMPSVPTYCYEADRDESGEGNCAKCFENARASFNEVRYKFIKLAIIYRCTKSFADKSMAFGDDVSSIHGVSGLAWQAEKRKIEESVERLKKSYDDKYIELLQRLRESMIDIAECEEEFGERDWYDRFGFMFYEFMKEKYRRVD
jgi:hypothetical protein